jgi:hypothetical protein
MVLSLIHIEVVLNARVFHLNYVLGLLTYRHAVISGNHNAA